MSSHSGQKQGISITVDRHLLNEIDKLSSNRSAAFEEGIRLWYVKQIEESLRKFYQSQSQADIDFEEEWADDALAHIEQILNTEEL